MSKAVLILGAFNPVTNAHIDMGIRAHEVFPDAHIIYVPAKADYLKGWKMLRDGQVMSEKERYDLLKEAIEKYGFEISDVELNGASDGRTYNTAICFKEPIICIGSDKLQELDLWYNAEILLKRYKFLVVTRNNDRGRLPESLEIYSDKLSYVEGTYQDISATMIRDAYKEGRLDEVKQFIPDNIYRYLKSKEELYV